MVVYARLVFHVVKNRKSLWTCRVIQLSLLTASLIWAVKYTQSGCSTTKIFRRIGIASSVMGRLTNVWRLWRLSISTKMRLYNAFVKSILLYVAEIWTILKSYVQKIEAFHMSCQRRILGIRWYDFISSTKVVDRTHEESITTQVQRRRLALFGHVGRLLDTVPANAALRLCIDARSRR